ncbi:hypothetical protein WA158_005545 [Blastocystis sp. Blastoise]
MSKFITHFNETRESRLNVDFCPVCGTILELPESGEIACGVCKFKCTFEDLHNTIIVSHSKPKAPLAWLEEDKKKKEKSNNAFVDEECPRCGHSQMMFYTLQLRSADEGSTVFYECPKCRYKYSQNN